MASLVWQEAADGLHAGPYRVRRVPRSDQRRWQLEILRRGPGWHGEPVVSAHRTQRAALATAAMYERHRVRRVRLQVHVGLFTVAGVAWMVASYSTDAGLLGFLAWVALFGVALKSLANALDVVDMSLDADLSRDPERLLTIERWVHVDSLVPPRAGRSAGEATDEVKVRVLDPFG